LFVKVIVVLDTRTPSPPPFLKNGGGEKLENTIDSGMVFFDKLRVFINKTLSILNVYQ
jgi:hypothetical protein